MTAAEAPPSAVRRAAGAVRAALRPAGPPGYNPVLDGLRALAVAAVIGDHAGFHGHGFHGVTVFFVISGYLITSLLIQEHARTGTVRLGRFYWRRFVRLGPALIVVVAVVSLFLLLVRQPVETYWAGPLGALTYTTDLIQAAFGNHAVSLHFQWSWSLGVEEQFYLLWPAALLLLWPRHRRLLVPVLLALVAAAWVVRAAQIPAAASHEMVFFSPFSHFDSLVLGVLVALFRVRTVLGPRGELLCRIAGLLGGAGLLLLELRGPNLPGVSVLDPNGIGQAAVFATGVVLWASARPTGPVAAVLGSAPLAWVGRLSYGLYLWNMLTVQVFLRLTGHHPAEIHKGLLWAAGLLAVCTLSYYLVERPIRRRWASPAFLDRPSDVRRRAPAVGAIGNR